MSVVLKSQKGNAVILTIWTLSVLGLMIVIIMNIAKVYVVKEQASIAAEQASLAASAVVYDEVGKVIEHYENEDLFEDETLQEKVEKEEQRLQSQNGNLSLNEAHIQAIDYVLLQVLRQDEALREEIKGALERAGGDVQAVVSNIISKNGGKPSGTQIHYFNDDKRIEVVTSARFEAVKYKSMFTGSDSDVSQRGIGIEIPFVDEVGWNSRQRFTLR